MIFSYKEINKNDKVQRMEKVYKIIVAHPGKQHSFKLASALKKNNMLFKYVTTVYDKDNSILMKIIKKILTKENKARANTRKNKDLLEEDVIQFGETRGLIEIFLARYDKSKKIYNWWQKKTTDFFGEKVAKLAIQNNVDAVILYDTNAKKCFEILEKEAPNILRIMDVSAVNRLYMKKIYEEDMKRFPLFAEKLKRERLFLWNKENCERLKIELEKTQFFLAPSQFVKKSLLYSGVKENQIAICPYGSNFNSIPKKEYNIKKDKLKAIYVGNVTAMKGVHYLLKAILEIPKEKIELIVVGSYDNSSHVFDKYLNRVQFTGKVLHKKVKNLLSQADIFIFPSLGDGMGLSVLEAMSCGLCCIVTRNAGASDAIVDGVNGFVVDAQNEEVLKEKILWLYENKNVLSQIGKEAIKSIEKYTWDNYESNVAKILRKKFGDEISEI